VERGLQLPVENQIIRAANHQFVCADPRNGVAVFEFMKPKGVGLIPPSGEREVLCEVTVPVNPNTAPLFVARRSGWWWATIRMDTCDTAW